MHRRSLCAPTRSPSFVTAFNLWLCARRLELAVSSHWRKLIVFSGRVGGRQDSDGACSQAKVYTHVGDPEKDELGCVGTWGVGAGVTGRERKCGVGKWSRAPHRQLLNIPLFELMSQPIGLTCTKCSNAVTDCRLHYTPNGLEIISTALCLSVLFQSFVWRITAVIVGWLSHGSPGVAPSCVCFCHQQAGTVKTAPPAK